MSDTCNGPSIVLSSVGVEVSATPSLAGIDLPVLTNTSYRTRFSCPSSTLQHPASYSRTGEVLTGAVPPQARRARGIPSQIWVQPEYLGLFQARATLPSEKRKKET